VSQSINLFKEDLTNESNVINYLGAGQTFQINSGEDRAFLTASI